MILSNISALGSLACLPWYICPTYRLITEKYTDIRRRMAEKEAAKVSARREAVGFVPKFVLYRKEREAKW